MISIMMRDSKKINGTVSFFLGILLIGLGLQAGSSIKGNHVVFPSLNEILQALIHLLGNADTYSKIGTTLLHVAEALAFSAGIGILIGLAEGSVQWLYSLLRPFMIVIRSLPMIVTVILVMSLLSYRIVPFTATSMILIPVFSEAVYEGCHSLDPDLINVYRINGSFGIKVILYVYLPLLSGYLKQAFVNAAGMGVKIAISAEYLVQTKNSLGKAIYSSTYFNESIHGVTMML